MNSDFESSQEEELSQTYRIELDKKAAKDFKGLPSDIQKRIKEAIDKLQYDPRPPGCKKLKAFQPPMRIRVGDYRILYEVDDLEKIVYIGGIGHRREIYGD
ncbi:type II toxin-antitoxin system RelE family toxin [Gloeothece verrucosa]|uniref:Plasmid stabilization system n=1 Tax=Gloeothece verrucosa (strain PCC 7822) TaxID=497965 RepID=E0UNC8_GLOV7|nr:type II toxin-antitoxin system RelE/ParE family toxin [Gloeothece verrucosa]ADN18458.1 plasmid stabilization system [Gloeothece verrucosa PCC 7822]